LYTGKDVFSEENPPQSADALPNTEDINGHFPEAVYIKTRTQSFNLYHYYILRNGLIWYKSIDRGGEPAQWRLFQKTGLPHNFWKAGFNKPDRIVEISADADELVALSDTGGFYRYCFDKTIAHKSNVWLDRQGWPDEGQLFLDRRTAKNISWALGKRNAHVLYYEDPFGNQHHNGTMEIATTYMLLEDGQEICYADTGLPPDFSRNYIGPERGAFKAAALSASASTMFVINEAGEMYTRLADFDTVGCDPMLFKYTYIPYESGLPGTDFFSNLNEWGLPAEDWRPQPPIPLTASSAGAGSRAAITRHITILQNGQGNGARELRVAGLNEWGKTGYWTKAVFDDAWEFKPVPLYFGRDAFLKTAGLAAEEKPLITRGRTLDKSYRGYSWKGNEKEEDWEYTIPNFNILEGDCDFQVTWRGETCTLKLHPLELWTYVKRDYLPGRTGSPKMFLVTLEVPENAVDGLSGEFAARIVEKYAKHDRKIFHYTLAALDRALFMQAVDDAGSVLFLTDGELSRQYPEFQRFRLVGNFEELQRYCSPELSFGSRTTAPYWELKQKITANAAFLRALNYQIRDLEWAQLTAFKINVSYLPAHYIARLTPLRFVDIPKIRTITTFGNRIVLTNSAYIQTVFTIRIWVYKKIMELLEVRLLYYQELAKEYAETAGQNPSGLVEIPSSSRYSEDAADYWDMAGLPARISGTFFSPDTHPRTRPVVLSFIRSGGETERYGWRLSLRDPDGSAAADQGASIFIDPLQSLRVIYSRRGKDPKEKKLHLSCTLYLNAGIDSPIEKDSIDRMLSPYIKENNRGIPVRINFNGEDFEIRQDPAGQSDPLIFRGKATLWEAPF
jgi:hypothetical protein